jgi:hypothetical protein
VFVLWKHPLFFETVRLLLQHPQIQLSGATIDDVDSKEKIEAGNPELLILERPHSDWIKETDLLDYLGRNVRVIWLSLDDNILSEFIRHNHTVSDQEELINLVLDSVGNSEG